jgi:hypothetical protein
MRVFGGTGRASRELRAYAALHGITVIDPEHWPAPVLAADGLRWPHPGCSGPSADDCRTLTWLCRPMQAVLRPLVGRGFLIPPSPSPSLVSAALDLQDHWSDRLWDAVDAEDGWFDRLRARTGTPAA